MTTVRLPVSCDAHDVTAMLGAEIPGTNGGRDVIGLHCVDCGTVYYAEEACLDCHEVSEHAFNCQMNWI